MEPQQNDSGSEQPSPTTPTTSSTSETPSGGKNKLLIGVIIAAVILLVLGAVLIMNNDSDKDKNSSGNNSSSTQNDSNDADTYVSEDGGFSFIKPAGWEQGETPNLGGGKGVLYRPPGATQEDLAVILVASYPLPEGKTPKQVVDEGLEFAKSYPGYTLVENKELQHNGNEAVYTEIKGTINGKEIHQSQLAVAKGDRLYSVTSTLPEAQWAANQERIKTVQDSLKIE